MLRLTLFALAAAASWARPALAVAFDSLTEGERLAGFEVQAVYLNAAEVAFGARLLHRHSGFTLELLQIESVPQSMLCLATFPTSDMGEPHTQEHLVLGKGNQARRMRSAESMALVTSTAYVVQRRTCYAFYTLAGPDVFFEQFEIKLDAYLHPDYTDEEVRREVRNFAVVDHADGTLGLEEQGSVYHEMVGSTDQPNRRMHFAALHNVYGTAHPLSFDPGGTPEGLRRIQPQDIRDFHASHYHLANMTAAVSLPREVPLEHALASFDEIFLRLEPIPRELPVVRAEDLPPPRPAPEGEIRRVEYPHANAQQPSAVWLVWGARPKPSLRERTLLELFRDTVAGDASANLYRRFIDSRTRELDLGAQNVFGSFLDDIGMPLVFGFTDVPVARMTDAMLEELRAGVRDELQRIASWPDGSPQLQEFHERMRARLVAQRRSLSNFAESPPELGFRGVRERWIEHLHRLDGEGGFHRSVTLDPVLDEIEALLTGPRNPWGEWLARWGLLDVSPWVLAARPSPELLQRQSEERRARVDEEIQRLQRMYAVDDAQEAVRRYRDDYDARSAEIDRAAAEVVTPPFIEAPPLTLDDPLDYTVLEGPRGITLVASTFRDLSSATVGIALRIDGVDEDDLLYVAALPELLAEVGVLDGAGNAVAHDEMRRRLREEVLRFDARFSTNASTGRVELVIRGAGNDRDEAVQALDWMRRVLAQPYWTADNLPRIRDLLDQRWSTLLRTRQTAEERWVRDAAYAYRRQDHPVLLTATSFMTRAHQLHRLRWRLKEATDDERRAAVSSLREHAQIDGARADYDAQLAAWAASPERLLRDAAGDLGLMLGDVPDATLSIDWARLTGDMAEDLEVAPEDALHALDAVRRGIVRTGNARLFLVSSAQTREHLMPAVERMVAVLDDTPVVPSRHAERRRVDERLRQRVPDAAPVFVGLLNPSSQSGVFVHAAPFVHFRDSDPERVLDFLASNLYGGGGNHSLFLRTWGAGLAYSNGVGASPNEGLLNYYAERTPELPQTMRFVVGELQRAELDPSLMEYAISLAFGGIRTAEPYEARGERLAEDLADGLEPATVRRFRETVLELRRRTDLPETLFARMQRVYAQVMPGLDPDVPAVGGGLYFVIGPERQLAAWEDHLQALYGADVHVYRLYPRDFWL